MKKMRLCFPKEKTFADGFAEYVLDCKARNLREGIIHHYEESIKQIYKRIPPDTPIPSMNRHTMDAFYITLRSDPDINEVTMGTYAWNLKTLMRFFLKCKYIPHFEIPLPKADKTPVQTYTDYELRNRWKSRMSARVFSPLVAVSSNITFQLIKVSILTENLLFLYNSIQRIIAILITQLHICTFLKMECHTTGK